MTATLRIARASPTQENLRAILGLIKEAAAWLRYKDTDQWANPWPDEKARDARGAKRTRGREDADRLGWRPGSSYRDHGTRGSPGHLVRT